MNRVIFAVCTVLLLLIAVQVASAHKVNVFAWVEGDTVHTESYFPDGTPVLSGTIEVYDPAESLLLTGITDGEGMFHFTIPGNSDLTIVLDASMGHRATYAVSADELGHGYSEDSGSSTGSEHVHSTQGPGAHSPGTGSVVSHPDGDITLEAIREVVREEVSLQLAPLAAKISRRAGEGSIPFRDIIAGIGYIVGLMGLVMYFQSRRKR